jgi:type VI protein secretion system component Hcp
MPDIGSGMTRRTFTMSADEKTQPAVDDVADLEVQETEQVVGGMHDINITKKVDKSSPML